jgi:aldehyde dehydrogenase (NAD+)
MADNILSKHKAFYNKGFSKDIDYRIDRLEKLRNTIKKYETEILEALEADLGKAHFEGYATEVGYCLESIRYLKKNIRKWSRDKKVRTPYYHFVTKSFIQYEPYGTVLIIGPFNYPFQLIIEPLAGAIAAGNTVIVKPSRYTENVEGILGKIIKEVFEEGHVTMVTGGRESLSRLLESKLDYIFFTGSVNVGKIIMEAASNNLVPVTLELGGKSPAIVHKDANLKIAAKRIVWGKFINTGQTCIAPDYLFVHSEIRDDFLNELKNTIIDFYGSNPEKNNDYGRIVNEKQFLRLISLIDEDKIYHGGKYNRDSLYIEPTILENIDWNDKVMEDEIFGPILPVLEYDNLASVVEVVNLREKPLSLYIFSENKTVQDEVVKNISFGGGCINDTLIHSANPYIPFGGVGNSGIGSYHGKYSFLTFSHKKCIMKKSTRFELGLVFPPYKDKINLIRKILK